MKEAYKEEFDQVKSDLLAAVESINEEQRGRIAECKAFIEERAVAEGVDEEGN